MADPVLGTSRGQDLPVCWMLIVYLIIPTPSSCSALQGTPAREAQGLGSQWQDFGGRGQVVFQGSSGWELWRESVPGRALASLMLPACQPQLLPGGFKTVSSSCFKFPGRGLQGGGAAGRLGCGLLFTRALCGMQLSRLEAPTIASSWAVSQPKELGGGGHERGAQEHKGSLPAQRPFCLPGWLLLLVYQAWLGILGHKCIYKLESIRPGRS